jgi:hypothetical protein
VAEWEYEGGGASTGNQISGEEKISLEGMVDRHGLEAVIETLAEICYEKGDHLRTNWQDEKSAKSWDRMGKQLNKFAGGLI